MKTDHPCGDDRCLSTAWWAAIPLLTLLVSACQSPLGSGHATSQPPNSWLEWKAKRHESIAGTNGWLTLVGRHWLAEGENTCGQDPTNQIVLNSPRAPKHLGRFVRTGKTIRFEAAPDELASEDGQRVRNIEMQSDHSGKATALHVQGLVISVIDRGQRIGLRVRDPQSPARFHFDGLKYFPYAPHWVVEGRYHPLQELKVFKVDTVIGTTQDYRCPGAISFRHQGMEYRLEVFEEEGTEDFFVLFKDATSGRSSYQAGRFLYVKQPDAHGNVSIDFNRAYTPPCGFTHFATCPLPPRQNWLTFPIRAGERAPLTFHH